MKNYHFLIAISILSLFLLSNPILAQQPCTDTDGGQSYFVKGIASGTDASGTTAQTDFCITGGNQLAEYYCQNNQVAFEIYSCPYGCSDGACSLQATPTPSGSCQGYCNTQSPSGCWCDSLCTGYGDCCSDYKSVCGGVTATTPTPTPTPTPTTPTPTQTLTIPSANSCSSIDTDGKNYCGKDDKQVPGSSPACYCDAACDGYGDCCSDYKSVCASQPTAGVTTALTKPSLAECDYTNEYYGDDGYCDDDTAFCKSQYVKTESIPKCKECSIIHTDLAFGKSQKEYCKSLGAPEVSGAGAGGAGAQITSVTSPHLVNEFTWCSGGNSYVQFVWNPAPEATSHDLYVNGYYFENVEPPYSRVVNPGIKIAEWSVAANFADGARVWADNGVWGGWSTDACLEGTTPAAGDTQAPTVAVESLEEGQTVNGDVWIWVIATDNIPLSQQLGFHVGLFVDNVDFNSPHDTDWAASDQGLFAVLLRTGQLSDGPHQVIVYAFDWAGHISEPSSVTVNVLNKPQVYISGSVPGSLDDIKNYIRGRVDDNSLTVPAGFVGAGTHSFGAVLWGLAGCESSWNLAAIGAAGEKGPFQYMPSTWAGTSPGRAGKSIFDPTAQVDATVEMLSNGRFSDWTCFKPNQWGRYWTQFTGGW